MTVGFSFLKGKENGFEGGKNERQLVLNCGNQAVVVVAFTTLETMRSSPRKELFQEAELAGLVTDGIYQVCRGD